MTKLPKTDAASLWARLERAPDRYSPHEYPMVTVVVPTLNSDQGIGHTLASLRNQYYPDLEIIIIDAGSTDRTLKIIRGCADPRIRIYTVTNYNLYEMFNKGISLAEGEYVNFLYPGDHYLQNDALRDAMSLALDHSKPDLVYGGSVIREGKEEMQVLYRPLTLDNLKRGLLPTSLQACWYRKDLFQKIGKFHKSSGLRANYDFLCRFIKTPGLRAASTSRVYTDHGLTGLSTHSIAAHFADTLRTIQAHFGPAAAAKWIFVQKDLYRLVRLAARNVKIALVGH